MERSVASKRARCTTYRVAQLMTLTYGAQAVSQGAVVKAHAKDFEELVMVVVPCRVRRRCTVFWREFSSSLLPTVTRQCMGQAVYGPYGIGCGSMTSRPKSCGVVGQSNAPIVNICLND